MKRLTNIYAGLALALVCAPLAMAQPAPNHDTTHGMASGHGEKSNMAMPHQATPTQRMAYSGHTWHHGDHYDGGRHVVSNWQQYRLRQPPAGYEWVRDGNQFVLIAVTSGIIADVIANAINE